MKKLLLSFLLSSSLAFGSGFFGGATAGTSVSPNFTGTPTFYTNRMTITDGTDRINIDAEVFQFKTGGLSRVYIAGKSGVHPQFTLQNADQWMEPGDGAAPAGSIAAFTVSQSDLGYSTIQQDVITGASPFRNLWLTDSIRFIAPGERTTMLTAGTTHTKIAFSGTVAAVTQKLDISNITAITWKNPDLSRYIEQYLGYSAIYKTQQNVDMWVNDAKFVSYSSTAAKARVNDAVLVNGTVTVTNTNNDAADRIFTQLKTPGGTLCLGVVKYSISAGTNFTLTAVQTDGTTCTTDTSTYSWWIVNKQ